MTARRADAGLSLIEVVVSLAIFAVIGLAGLALLDTMARTGERTEGRLERLSEIDRALLVLRRDLAVIAPRGVALEADALRFARDHGDEVVAITYRMEDTTFVREIGGGASRVSQRLLPDVAAARWRLMDRARAWHDQWPPQGAEAEVRPAAAELTLEVWRADQLQPTTITRLMALPAGQGR